MKTDILGIRFDDLTREAVSYTHLDVYKRQDEEWSALPARAPDVTTEDRHVLRAALSVLSEQERQVVMLHAVTGLKHREIAQLLELPLATVLSKYRRALKKLNLLLEGDDA